MENNVITIKDKNGIPVELEVLEEMSIDNNNYIILSPIGGKEAYAYKVKRIGSEDQYTSLTEGPEFQKVLQKYNSMNQ